MIPAGASLLIVIALALGLAVSAALVKRAEARRLGRSLEERVNARSRGSAKARLQYPEVDLTRCIGCGTCVAACPEEGVLDVIHGQAQVVHGARCVGHGRCAEECPVGAIAITLGDLSQRDDIPAVDGDLRVVGSPGLYLAGEVTGFALIRTAIAQGTTAARTAAKDLEGSSNGAQLAGDGRKGGARPDLLVVGSGPAGLACALEGKRLGLGVLVLDREGVGGTVAKYPRRKLVMTQPVEFPLHGRLGKTSYSKEELMELWERIVRQEGIAVRGGTTFEGLESRPGGGYVVATDTGPIEARSVCLALGRRGTPRRLGVPGEDLPKVAYGLLDAQSYRHRSILVVGGGDSAVEAAMGLAEQEGNRVSLSYRGEAFHRIRARNEARLARTVASGELELILRSRVRTIGDAWVDLEQDHREETGTLRLPNDDVFVLAGGVAPFELLGRSGVSFDPKDRPEDEGTDAGTRGWPIALALALVMGIASLGWVLVHRDYYFAPLVERIDHPRHALLRPGRGLGLGLGLAASLAMVLNLAYLLRRAPGLRFVMGSLRRWMAIHMATGVAALVLAILHGGLVPRNSTGGHALLGLVVLVVTGLIGRFAYAFVPRSANGRELELDEARAELERSQGDWEHRNRELLESLRIELLGEAHGVAWERSFVGRWRSLLASQWRFRRELRRWENACREAGVAPGALRSAVHWARRAQRARLGAAHYEELRGILSSWRYLHRWVALAVVMLIALHVAAALRYGGVDLGVGGGNASIEAPGPEGDR